MTVVKLVEDPTTIEYTAGDAELNGTAGIVNGGLPLGGPTGTTEKIGVPDGPGAMTVELDAPPYTRGAGTAVVYEYPEGPVMITVELGAPVYPGLPMTGEGTAEMTVDAMGVPAGPVMMTVELGALPP